VAISPRSPSRTAILTAVARALHREEPPPWVLDDDLALPLTGEEGPVLIELLRAELPGEMLRVFARWVCVRARVPEDMVERAAAAVRQYVILGAGLDSFGYRRSDLLDHVRVFEVDHPASQAWKRARLAHLGIDQPANLVFAPIDFETQTLRQGLEAAGFDFGAPAVFSWIGVTMYLTLDAIEATLSTIASGPPGTKVVVTYNQPKSALQGLGLGIETVLTRIVDEMGEPMVSLFEPHEAEQLVRRMGFDEVVHFGPEEAVDTYFPGRSDVRFGGAQRLVVATVPDHQTARRDG
jgi:methyltransferase (TIGR00027 family)